MDYLNMEGKHILVTGAAGGIGRATCILLASLGAKVAMMDLMQEGLNETLSLLEGEGHTVHPADLSQIDALEPLVAQIVKDTGAFDGYVHSAGIVKNLPLKNYTFDRLHKIMLVNFYSYFEIVRILSKKGRYNEGMSIVGVSSINANVGATTQAAYSASKAAMNGAMRSLAKELGADKKIRLNTVLPGATDTAMYSDFQAMRAETGGTTGVHPRQYLGMNAPSDVASAIVYLLSPASRKITGVELNVDGGYCSC